MDRQTAGGLTAEKLLRPVDNAPDPYRGRPLHPTFELHFDYLENLGVLTRAEAWRFFLEEKPCFPIALTT